MFLLRKRNQHFHPKSPEAGWYIVLVHTLPKPLTTGFLLHRYLEMDKPGPAISEKHLRSGLHEKSASYRPVTHISSSRPCPRPSWAFSALWRWCPKMGHLCPIPDVTGWGPGREAVAQRRFSLASGEPIGLKRINPGGYGAGFLGRTEALRVRCSCFESDKAGNCQEKWDSFDPFSASRF